MALELFGRSTETDCFKVVTTTTTTSELNSAAAAPATMVERLRSLTSSLPEVKHFLFSK